jgi:hypothetical protein
MIRAASSRCGLTGIFSSGNGGATREKAEIRKSETLKSVRWIGAIARRPEAEHKFQHQRGEAT